MTLYFDVTIATCKVSEGRTSEMKQLDTSLLRASKIYDMSIRTALQCSAQCLSEPNCLFISRNAAETDCTLYTGGLTTYNIAGLITYAVQFKNIQVYNRLNINNIHLF